MDSAAVWSAASWDASTMDVLAGIGGSSTSSEPSDDDDRWSSELDSEMEFSNSPYNSSDDSFDGGGGGGVAPRPSLLPFMRQQLRESSRPLLPRRSTGC